MSALALPPDVTRIVDQISGTEHYFIGDRDVIHDAPRHVLGVCLVRGQPASWVRNVSAAGAGIALHPSEAIGHTLAAPLEDGRRSVDELIKANAYGLYRLLSVRDSADVWQIARIVARSFTKGRRPLVLAGGLGILALVMGLWPALFFHREASAVLAEQVETARRSNCVDLIRQVRDGRRSPAEAAALGGMFQDDSGAITPICAPELAAFMRGRGGATAATPQNIPQASQPLQAPPQPGGQASPMFSDKTPFPTQPANPFALMPPVPRPDPDPLQDILIPQPLPLPPP